MSNQFRRVGRTNNVKVRRNDDLVGYTIALSEDGKTAVVTSDSTPRVVNVVPVGSLNLKPITASA